MDPSTSIRDSNGTSTTHASARLFFIALTLSLFSAILVAVSVYPSASQAVVSLTDARQSSSLIASRLQSRLHFAADDVSSALEERDELRRRFVELSIVSETGGLITKITVSVRDFSHWIEFVPGVLGSVHAELSEKRIQSDIFSLLPSTISLPQSCTIQSVITDAEDVMRSQTSCMARSGYVIDTASIAHVLAVALNTRQPTLQVVLPYVSGTLTDLTVQTGSVMTLLATGKSNFKGSGEGRKSNVRKGIHERLHNVYIPADATFSFTDTLGIVSESRGWKQALTIFEGVNLRPAPGGGICQVSTTLYRAALRAGLPITEHKVHSLYVTYYEHYGIGLDATVFPGLQDMKFLNDTGAPILVQAYTDGYDAFVELYGKYDGRTVTMDGPYFKTTKSDEVQSLGRPLKGNEILWSRLVQSASGSVHSEDIVARYNAIPKSLAKKYPPQVEIVQTASVPSIVVAKQNDE